MNAEKAMEGEAPAEPRTGMTEIMGLHPLDFAKQLPGRHLGLVVIPSGEKIMAAPFKAYDVRGIYGKDVTEELAYEVGKAYIDQFGCRQVVIGQDMRTTSPGLAQALKRGMTEQGADVIDIGLASTDMMYFAVIHLQTDGGIIVTASHNSAAYNGFKLVQKDAVPIGLESGLDKIEERVRQKKFHTGRRKGNTSEMDVLDDFVTFMHGFVNPKELQPLKVVIDSGNGMGGHIVPALLKDSPVQVVPLFFELDGSFPNHEANPLIEENRRDLVAKVLEVKANLGVGLDGDSDRAFFVDDNGEFCSGDFILGLLAKEMVKGKTNPLIVYDVRCSRYVKETVAKLGGRTMMWKVGHAYAKNFMREHQAEFGGEVSGHYYFRYKNAYFDSGNLTFLVMLKLLSEKGTTLSQELAETKDYYISGEINSTVTDQDEKLRQIKASYADKVEQILEIDGISLIGSDWWANIRKSNTEPLLRLNCEGNTQIRMEQIRDEFLQIIRQ